MQMAEFCLLPHFIFVLWMTVF